MQESLQPNDVSTPYASAPTGQGVTPSSSAAASYTANALFIKPATAQRNWDVAINANADAIDGMAAVGQLLVTPTEVPSASLNVRITSGSYGKGDGTVNSYPGMASYPLAASSSTSLWLSDSGILNNSPAFPATAHVRLAEVVTGASTVSSVVDARIGCRAVGTGLGFVLKAGDTVSGPFSIVATGTGTPVLTVAPNAPGVGFFGTAPASQAPAITPLVNNSAGSASNTLSDVGATYSQATIDGNFATLAVAVNGLIVALKRHGLMSS